MFVVSLRNIFALLPLSHNNSFRLNFAFITFPRALPVHIGLAGTGSLVYGGQIAAQSYVATKNALSEHSLQSMHITFLAPGLFLLA